jgi:hypothetical protein
VSSDKSLVPGRAPSQNVVDVTTIARGLCEALVLSAPLVTVQRAGPSFCGGPVVSYGQNRSHHRHLRREQTETETE